VEVRVEGGADQRVDFDRLTFYQHRLKGLNAESVQCWSAVEQDRMIFDDFFQNVPDHRIVLFDQLFGLLDRGAVPTLLEPVVDEWLEQLECSVLGSTALTAVHL